MGTFTRQMAVITGASRGMGKAIALKLAAAGATLCLIGRNQKALQKTAREADTEAHIYLTDLAVPDELEGLVDRLRAELERVDILVHSAGVYATDQFAQAPVEELDTLYAVNVRAPFRLTQGLLPLLIKSRGQIIFINSLVVLKPSPNVAQSAAAKPALRAFTDSLWEELNIADVRLISIYPGRSAGAIRERLFSLRISPINRKDL